MVADQGAQARPFAHDHRKKIVEGLFLKLARDHRQGRPEPILGAPGAGQQFGHDPGQQFARFALRKNLEMGRHVRLQRKTGQEGLTEGVDGLDTDAARRLQHPGEQAAGGGDPGIVGRLAGQFGQRLADLRFRLRRPIGQDIIEAHGHLRRRRAGEGQAQNGLGPGARQHQAKHPVGQNLGLAGPRRSPDPGRMGRIGGEHLRGGHSSPPPPADHSAIRARWA